MAGDPAILAVYSAHRGELVNYASAILGGDRAQAEDVVQEAYLRFSAAAGERSLGEPLAYLYRIVRNLSLDVHRRLGRERTVQVPDAEHHAAGIADPLASPEAHAVGRQEVRLMEAALAELPERTRIALEMHRFGGLSFKAIAGELGISVGLAHLLVVQALEHCRQRLARPAPGDPDGDD